jgi:hypothetical protein
MLEHLSDERRWKWRLAAATLRAAVLLADFPTIQSAKVSTCASFMPGKSAQHSWQQGG